MMERNTQCWYRTLSTCTSKLQQLMGHTVDIIIGSTHLQCPRKVASDLTQVLRNVRASSTNMSLRVSLLLLEIEDQFVNEI